MKNWFFDLDGTLADTAKDILGDARDTLESFGVDVSQLEKKFVIGPPLEKIVRDLCPDAAPDMYAAFMERFKARYDSSDYPRTAPYAGMPRVLETLKDRGMRIFIVTNKRDVPTKRIVRRLGWEALFDGVWSFDTFGVKYTKGGLLGRLLSEMGIAPDEAVMVGDTKGDVDAGRENGMRTCGVSWGYGSRAELAAADLIANAPAELLEQL